MFVYFTNQILIPFKMQSTIIDGLLTRIQQTNFTNISKQIEIKEKEKMLISGLCVCVWVYLCVCMLVYG